MTDNDVYLMLTKYVYQELDKLNCKYVEDARQEVDDIIGKTDLALDDILDSYCFDKGLKWFYEDKNKNKKV